MNILAPLACLPLLAVLAPAAFADDVADCNAMTAVVADSNRGAPYMVDEITRAEVAAQDCALKTARFSWTVMTDTVDLAENWRDLVKANFEQGFCGDAELATLVRSGWAITAKWTTQDGVVYLTDVACP